MEQALITCDFRGCTKSLRIPYECLNYPRYPLGWICVPYLTEHGPCPTCGNDPTRNRDRQVFLHLCPEHAPELPQIKEANESK